MRPGVFDGGATYSLNVIRHLPRLLPEWELVVYCCEGEERIATAPNLDVRPIPIRSAARRALFETTALSRLRADVFVSPNESLPLLLPAPTVVVAQNLAYHCGRVGAAFRGGSARERFASTAQAAYYRRRMPEAYRRATRVVVISRTAAELLARRAQLPLAKASVAYGGSDSFLLERHEPRPLVADRLLVVSTLAPYKSFPLVVELLARLRRACPALEVRVAGANWRGYRRVIEEDARRAGVAGALKLLGPQPPPAIAGLYTSSTALLHLSECEACPLPPLEAMRAGLPVIAARRSSIPEVLGEGALLVDPDDVDGMEAAVLQLLDDPDALTARRARGLARAEELTWSRTAEGIADAIRSAWTGTH